MIPARFRPTSASTPPLTFSLDASVPKLPLPSLEDTLSRYRTLALPFCNSQAEVAQLDESIRASLVELQVAQSMLAKRHASTDNYVDEWWKKKGYLEDRSAIVPQESSSGDWSCHWSQTERAALTMFAAAKVHATLVNETYPVLGPSSNVHWSMHQFRPVFEACRIPKLGCDEHFVNFRTKREHGDLSKRHFIVGVNGRLYKVNANLSLAELALMVQEIERDAFKPFSDAEFHSVGYLTGCDRDFWAKTRSQLIATDSKNMAVLHAIETALAFVTLDPSSPGDDGLNSVITALSFPSDAASRWFDKSTQFVVFKNGKSGHSMEHSVFVGFVPFVLLLRASSSSLDTYRVKLIRF